MRPSARFLLDKERAWISRLVATNSPVWHESHVSQTHDLGDCNCLQNNFLSPKSLRWRWWQTASPWILSWLAHTDWQQRLAIFQINEFLMRLYGLLNLSFNVNQNSSANRTRLSGSVIMKKLTWELSDVEKKYCGAQNLWWLFFQPLLFNTSVSFSKAFLFFFFLSNENVSPRKQPTFCDATSVPREMTFWEETNGNEMSAEANVAFSFGQAKGFC